MTAFSWRCVGCREVNEPNFEICWKCGRERNATGGPDASDDETEGVVVAPEAPDGDPVFCVVCETPLEARGEIPIRFQELGETLWPVVVYACPTCGRLAFYEPR